MNRDWIRILAKWRTVLAGWQLGTRAQDDPECAAVRDHRELSLALRAEMNAVVGLLIEKGVFTLDEFVAHLQEEARLLNDEYAKRFPGFEASETGITMHMPEAATTMARLKFKP